MGIDYKASKPRPVTEKSIELKICKWLKEKGYIPIKAGKNGYPDRLVLTGSSQHVWLEIKNETGRLTKAQRAVVPILREIGDEVYIVRTLEEVKEIFR